jgi:hypothetical protein
VLGLEEVREVAEENYVLRSRYMCVELLDMVSRRYLLAGLHVRLNAQRGMLRWCQTAHFGRCTPWSQSQLAEQAQNVAETRIWVHQPVPTNSFLARPCGEHYIAVCKLEAAVSDVLCK